MGQIFAEDDEIGIFLLFNDADSINHLFAQLEHPLKLRKQDSNLLFGYKLFLD